MDDERLLNIKLKDISGIFIVKDYQRGYRWGREDIRKLLKDKMMVHMNLSMVNKDLLLFFLFIKCYIGALIWNAQCLILSIKLEVKQRYL